MNPCSIRFILPRGCLIVCCVLATLLSSPLRAADPRTIRIEENDTVRASPGSGAVVFELTLSLAPVGDPEAVLQVTQGSHVRASVPLRRAGPVWRAEVPAASLGNLLTSDLLVARFPSSGERPLHVTIPRDRFLPRLADVQSLVGDAPLFFEAPSAPERPTVPSADVSRAEAEAFVAGAWVFDQQWAGHVFRFSGARAAANGLFRDLVTSGRFPWQGEVVARLESSYENLKKQQDEMIKAREAWREEVRSFAQRWNAAHGGEEPLTVTFATAS